MEEVTVQQLYRIQLGQGETPSELEQPDKPTRMVLSRGQEKKREKPQTVRKTGPEVGRNDPCPCGSGKKYKKCCGRPGVGAPAQQDGSAEAQ